MRFLLTAIVLAAAAALPVSAAAQAYPSRTVHIIVPSSPGGGLDVVARLVAAQLAKIWGQSVVVENRPGASMIIGITAAARATPDGYTLLVVHDGPMAMNPVIYAKLPYDPQRDFVPVSNLVTNPYAIIVTPSLGINTVAELLAYARANPGKLNHASGGPNTIMALELFNSLADVRITSVLYKGLGPAITSVMAGETHLSIPDTGSANAAIRSGKVKILAVTTLERVKIFPNVPTVSESGVPGYENSIWTGLFAPAGAPDEIVAKISKDVHQVLAEPDVRDRLATMYMEPAGWTGEALAHRMRADRDKWARLVKERGIKFGQ